MLCLHGLLLALFFLLLAESERFELSEPVKVRRFSKPVRSTTLPTLRIRDRFNGRDRLCSTFPLRVARSDPYGLDSPIISSTITENLLHRLATWISNNLLKIVLFKFLNYKDYLPYGIPMQVPCMRSMRDLNPRSPA